MLLAARRAAREMGSQARKSRLGVLAGELELDETVDLVEALVAADLRPSGAEEAVERFPGWGSFGHVVSSSHDSRGIPRSSR